MTVHYKRCRCGETWCGTYSDEDGATKVLDNVSCPLCLIEVDIILRKVHLSASFFTTDKNGLLHL